MDGDTLTEDLDLSYRAQLKGWKFRYVETIASPAELPTDMNAVKSQQYRWNKGGAETARKMGYRVLVAQLPLKVKLHAIAHLFNTTNYIFHLPDSYPECSAAAHQEHLCRYQLLQVCQCFPDRIHQYWLCLLYATVREKTVQDTPGHLYQKIPHISGNYHGFIPAQCKSGI